MVPAVVSLPVPVSVMVVEAPLQTVAGVALTVAGGAGAVFAGTFTDFEHPVEVSVTSKVNTSEEHTNAVVNWAVESAITLPSALVHK